ncbi:MAG: hypothetical protein J5858_12420 [Lentisphaeria bacterium]|nr:hypothetical protein [Lentisphaeria bacterium]
MGKNIEIIYHGQTIIAIIIPHDFSEPGISFFTPDEFAQQIAYMQHSAGHVIPAHIHNKNRREILFTQETLILRKGKLKVDFYTEGKDFLESRILVAGDVILLASGGHGFSVLEDIEMLEVKQGPYTGINDKTRFAGENLR